MNKILASLAALALGLLAGTADADSRSYHQCQLTNGQVFSCDGSWYQGSAVVLRNGAYHKCSITNGQVFSCDGSWFQGRAVVYK